MTSATGLFVLTVIAELATTARKIDRKRCNQQRKGYTVLAEWPWCRQLLLPRSATATVTSDGKEEQEKLSTALEKGYKQMSLHQPKGGGIANSGCMHSDSKRNERNRKDDKEMH